MKILRTDIENLAENKKMLYKLTQASSKSVSKLKDEELDVSHPVDAYLQYEDVNSKGNPVTLLTIVSGSDVFTAQSQTLQESFFKIVDLMDGDPFSVIFTQGISKSGRPFVDCEMDCN